MPPLLRVPTVQTLSLSPPPFSLDPCGEQQMPPSLPLTLDAVYGHPACLEAPGPTPGERHTGETQAAEESGQQHH